jgi:RNA polymerase sigma factor (TIGR02999 family)
MLSFGFVSLLMDNVTELLNAIDQGDGSAAAQLLPLVYDELRKLAAHRMARETAGQTLDATALVHEAYLRLVGANPDQHWNGRSHFFAAAAEAMRRILVERARHKAALKSGGGACRHPLDGLEVAAPQRGPDLLALDEALAELERHDARVAELVKLRYFVGLTHQQAAEAMGIGRRTADGLWALARAWLFQRLAEE